MSETAPEPSGGNGGMLGRKFGPLPVWGWLLIITGIGLGWYLLTRKTSSSATGTGSSTPASDVPDYVSQTTVNVTEPAEPAPPSRPGPPPPPPERGRGKPGSPGKNGKPPVKASPKPAAKTASQPPIFSNSYTVKPGDTLDKLAEKFGVTRVELAHANGLGTGAGLRTGQVLKVPGPLKPRSEGGPG